MRCTNPVYFKRIEIGNLKDAHSHHQLGGGAGQIKGKKGTITVWKYFYAAARQSNFHKRAQRAGKSHDLAWGQKARNGARAPERHTTARARAHQVVGCQDQGAGTEI